MPSSKRLVSYKCEAAMQFWLTDDLHVCSHFQPCLENVVDLHNTFLQSFKNSERDSSRQTSAVIPTESHVELHLCFHPISVFNPEPRL